MKRMENKRATLAAEARQMVKSGVSFEALELPRSFRDDSAPVLPAEARQQNAEAATPATVVDAMQDPAHDSPFAGTSLDGKKLLLAYKRRKGKKDIPDGAETQADTAATEADS